MVFFRSLRSLKVPDRERNSERKEISSRFLSVVDKQSVVEEAVDFSSVRFISYLLR